MESQLVDIVKTYVGFDSLICQNYTCKYVGEMTHLYVLAWEESGQLHSIDGPAIEVAHVYNTYYICGKLHRKDGPAVEWADGDKEYYICGMHHREDGPAIEWANGDKYYYLHGREHRLDGPAIDCVNGYKAYCIHGIRLSFEEYQIEISRMNKPLPSKHTEETCIITLEQLHMGDKYDECPNHHVSICDENKGIYKKICPYCKQKYIGTFIQV